MSETSLLLIRFMHYRGILRRHKTSRRIYTGGKTNEAGRGSDSEVEEAGGYIEYKNERKEFGGRWGEGMGDVEYMGTNQESKVTYIQYNT